MTTQHLLANRNACWPATLVVLGALPLASRADLPPPPAVATHVLRPAPPRALVIPRAPVELSEANDSFASVGANPFNATAAVPTANGQTLIAPVTVKANTPTDALTVTQTGAGRAIVGTVSNGASAMSAVRGVTSSKGSGVNGVNVGTGGPAGKFEVTNAASRQPGVSVTTAGSYTALQAIVKGTEKVDTPAVLGQHNGVASYGTGVQGDGSYIGVSGNAAAGGYGVYGTSPAGYGVYGTSSSGFGASGISTSSIGVYGESTTKEGVYGYSQEYFGVYGYSSNQAGIRGESVNNFGVSAYSDGSYGLVAQSNSTYAGVFYGPVYVSGVVTANSYGYTSDRDQKQGFDAVDTADVLNRIAAMPITAWDYKARPTERHIGPMAQDFHSAFGLGADDKHIDVVDGIGVSLAAIQELQRRVQQKDARIDALEAEVRSLHGALDARLAALEHAVSANPVAAQP